MTYLSRVLIVLLLSVSSSFAENRGRIEGHVKDGQTNTALADATLIIEGTQIRATTDVNGYFSISDLPSGLYNITAQVVGYKSVAKNVGIENDKKVNVIFLLEILIPSEEIEVTAKWEKTPALTTLVSSLNKEDIKRSNPPTTAEAIKSIPGVSTMRPGGWGVKAVIQGMTDDRILVLIDGSRVNQACPMGSDACTATVDPDQIDYIEVIKGPNSVLYGSGNFAGVINIVTKKPEVFESDEFQTYGNLNLTYNGVSNGKKGGLDFGGKYKTFDFLFGAVGSNYDDYRIPSGTVENSGFKENGYNFKFGYLIDDNQRVGFSTDQYRGKDIGYPANFTIIPNERRSLYNLSYEASNLSGNLSSLSIKLYAQSLEHDALTTPPDKEFGHKEEAYSDTYGTTVKGNFSFIGKSVLTAGVDFSHWTMRAVRYDSDHEVQSPIITLPDSYISYFGIFGQNKFEISPKLNATLGGRIDLALSDAQITDDYLGDDQKSDSSDTFFSGNFGVLYQLSNNLNLTASIGKASKVANPTEKYFSATMPDGYYYYGTPSLRSEKNLSIQSGLSGKHTTLNWSVSLYQNKLTDLISAKIDPESEPPFPGLKGVKRYVNIGKAIIRGLAADLGIMFTNRISLYGNVAYTWGKDELTGEPLSQIPTLEGLIAIRYEGIKKRFWTELSGRFAGEQKRAAISSGETRTPGFSVFDFRGEFKLTDKLTINYGVENIFDKAYREHLNLDQIPEPGRNIFIGLKIGLRSSRPKKLIKEGKAELKKTQMIILNVESMENDLWVESLQKALKKIEGVIYADVNFDDRKAVVEIWEDSVSVDQLIDTLKETGCRATFVKSYLQVVILSVEDMHCQFCANRIKITLKKIRGVNSAEVNFKEKKVTIEIWKDLVLADQLIKRIQDMGFTAKLDKMYRKEPD